MFRLILNLLVLLIVSLVFNYLHQASGYVKINVAQYEVEVSLVIGFLILALATFVISYLFKFSSFLAYLIFRSGKYDMLKRYKKSIREILATLNAIALNDGEHTKKSIIKISRYLNDETGRNLVSILNYQAVRLLGDKDQEKFFLNQLKNFKGTKIMAFKELINLENQIGNKNKAVELAEEIFAEKKSIKGIAPFLLQLYKKTNNYEKALDLLTEIKQQQYLNFKFGSKRLNRQDIASIEVNKELSGIFYMLAVKYWERMNIPSSKKEDEDSFPYKLAKKAYQFDKKNIENKILFSRANFEKNELKKAEELAKDAFNQKERADVLDLLIKIEQKKQAPNEKTIEGYRAILKKLGTKFGFICLNCFVETNAYHLHCNSCDSLNEIAFVDDLNPYKLISKKHLAVATKN